MDKKVDSRLKLDISKQIVHGIFNSEDFANHLAAETGVDIYDIYSIVGYNYQNVNDNEFILLSEYFTKHLSKSEYVLNDFYVKKVSQRFEPKIIDYVKTKIFLKDFITDNDDSVSKDKDVLENSRTIKGQTNGKSFILAPCSI